MIKFQYQTNQLHFFIRDLSAEERAQQRKEKNKIRMRENRRLKASVSAKDEIVQKKDSPYRNTTSFKKYFLEIG